MDFSLSQNHFDSLGQWHAWRLGIDLADFVEAGTLEHRAGQPDLYALFRALYAALYAHPEDFGVPEKPYEDYRIRSRDEEDQLQARNLAVRKVIEGGVLEFLYQAGKLGEPDGPNLRLRGADYGHMVQEKTKKAKTGKFLKGLEQAGLSIVAEQDAIFLTCALYPQMPAALGRFAKACAPNKAFGYPFFRRCDFSVFAGKEEPDVEDVLRLVAPETREAITRTDALLRERKYKCVFFASDAQSGYRLRYSKKNDKIVYWLRVRNWINPDLGHNLRWPLASDLTPRLFAALDECRPGLSGQVFAGIRKCIHDYEPCGVRKIVAHGGAQAECCGEVCWNGIGVSPADFETLRQVIEGIEENIACLS